jgi:hypothetical protein
MRAWGKMMTLVALAWLTSGCEPEIAGGQTLGRFITKGARVESCADIGLLGAPVELKLGVFLRRVPDVSIHWEDDGGILYGDLDSDLNFTIKRQLSALVREETPDFAECRLDRLQQISGTLHESDTGEVTGFSAVRSDDYVPSAGAHCDDMLVSNPPLANNLPCSVVYELEGEAE